MWVLLHTNANGLNLLVSGKYCVYRLVSSSSHMQKSHINNEMQDQELLIFDTIAPIWAKRLEESKLLLPLSLKRLQLYLELKDASKCVVGEAYGFSSSYAYDCKWCSKIAWKFMFYFMIHSYSRLERTKKEFVKHWSEKHLHVCR